MRHLIVMLFLTAGISTGFAQKLKGSRAVTITQKEIAEFESIEVTNDIEVFLIKGDKNAVEIEADDNLHDAIGIEVSAGTLRINATQEVGSFKKFSVRITYTQALTMVVLKGMTTTTAITDLALDNLTIKTFDGAKFYASVQTKKFVLMANDKSKVELNLKADVATVELSKNANLKALISAGRLTFDMYQKTAATIEGDVIDMKLRLDNNANFVGKNLTVKNVELATEDYASGSIIASAKAVIAAGGKSEIQLYGEPKIEIIKFADSALLQKKPTTGKIN